jgi:MFS family permease
MPHWTMGAFYAACYLPFLLSHQVIGPLTDRWRKLPVLLSAHVALGVPVLLPLLLSAHTGLGMALLLSGSVFGAFYVFVPSFRYGLIADCFPRPQRPRILILSNTAAVMAMSSAPLLHAYLKRVGDSSLITQVVVGLLAVSMGLYARLRVTQTTTYAHALPSVGAAPITAFSVDRRGLAYCAMGICLIGPLQVLVPSMLARQFGLDAMARDFFMALIGVGIVLSVPVSVLIKRSQRKTNLYAVFTLAVCCLGMALAHAIAVLAVLLLAAVMAAGFLVNRNQTALQEHVSDQHQGRLMAMLAAVNMGTPAATGALAGIASSIFGVPTAFLAIGLAMVTVAMALEMRPRVPNV